MPPEPAHKPGRPGTSRLIRPVGLCLGFFLGSAAVLAAAMALVWARPGLVKPWLERALAPEGGAARVETLSLELTPLILILRQVSLTSPEQAEPILDLEELRLQADPWAGLRKGLWLRRVSISRPRLRLSQGLPPPDQGRDKGPSQGAAGLPDLSGLKLLLGMEELRLAQGGLDLDLPWGRARLEELSASLIPVLTPEEGTSTPSPDRTEARIELQGRVLIQAKAKTEEEGLAFQGLVKARGRLGPGPALNLELVLKGGRVVGPGMGAELELAVDLGLDAQRLRVINGRAALKGLSLPLPEERQDLSIRLGELDLDLLLRGWLDLDGEKGRMDLERVRILGPQGADLVSFSGAMEKKDSSGLEADIKGGLNVTPGLWEALALLLPRPYDRAGFRGRVPFSAGLDRDGLRLALSPEGKITGPAGDDSGPGPVLWLAGTEINLEGRPEGPWWASFKCSLVGEMEEEVLSWEGRLQAPAMDVFQEKGTWSRDLSGRVEGRLSRVGPVLEWLGPFLPEPIPSLTVQGLVPFSARLEAGNLGLALNPGQAKARLDRAALGIGMDLDLEGTVLELGGPLTGPLEIKGRLRAQGSAQGQEWRLGPGGVSAELAGDLLSPRLEKLRLSLPPRGVAWQGKKQPLGRVELKGRAGFEPGTGLSGEVESLKVAELGAFQGRFGLDKGRPRAELGSKEVDLAGAAKILGAAGLVPPDWSVEGKAGLSLNLKPGKQGPGLGGKVELAACSVASSDGGILMDKLAGELAFRAGLGKRPEVDSRFSLRQGEVLVGTVYLDLGGNPLDLGLKIGQDKGAKGRKVYRLDLSGGWGRLGRFKINGRTAAGPGFGPFQGRLDLEKADLAFLYQTLVKDPLSLTNPALAALEMKGRAGLGLEFRGSGTDLSFQGRLKLREVGLSRETGAVGTNGSSPKKEVLLERLDLDLPLDYRLGAEGMAEPPFPKPGEWGRLSLAGLKLPFGDRMELELPIALKPNRLFLGKGAALDLWGGRLEVSEIRVDRPLSTDLLLSCVLDLQGLDLSRLDTGGMPLEGSLSGRLEEIRLGPGSLWTKGRIRGTVYGGEVVIDNIFARRPISPGRTFGADLTFEKLHLERLSQALDLGMVTGRISGGLTGLEVAYGQPVAFDLILNSVKEKGVSQRVNLKAVNSISVLGTGAGLQGVGVKMVTTFFKDFPYKKIGIQCKLRNDVFQVKGLIKEGGKEYLVRKPAFSGINVVNSNPDNRISFSDMRERLKRITSSEEGPTIK